MITNGAVDRAVHGWIADECSRSTVKNSLAVLVRVMEQALRDGIIDRNPARVTGWQREYKLAEDELDDPRALALPDWNTLTTLADALVARSVGRCRRAIRGRLRPCGGPQKTPVTPRSSPALDPRASSAGALSTESLRLVGFGAAMVWRRVTGKGGRVQASSSHHHEWRCISCRRPEGSLLAQSVGVKGNPARRIRRGERASAFSQTQRP